MTISSTNRKAGPYTGNGVTVAFPFAFKVFSASDVLVVRTDLLSVETDLTLTTDYTVTLNADQDANPGGTVTTLAAPATGYLITLTSAVQNLQQVVLAGAFYPKVINDALDRLTIFAQQLSEQIGRAVKTSISSSINPDVLLDSLIDNVALASINATSAANSANSASDSAAIALAAAENATGLPTQTGNGGKFLTTNGTSPSWGDPLPDSAVTTAKLADGAATGAKLGADVALKAGLQAQTYKAFTTGGTSTAFTLTPSPAIAALTAGQEFDVTFHAAAGAAPTLNINALGAKLLKYRDYQGNKLAVTSTQLPSGWRSRVVYDGTDYIVREIPPAASSASLNNEGVQIIKGGGLNMGASATYYVTGSGLAMGTSEVNAQRYIPAGTRISQLRVFLNAAPSAGTVVATVRKDGVDTGLTVTLSAGQTVAADIANSVDFLVDGLLSLKVVTSGLSPTTIDMNFSMVVTDFNTGAGKPIVFLGMNTGGPAASSVLGEAGTINGLAYATVGGAPFPPCIYSEAVGTNGTDLVQNGVITSVSPILISELDTISTYLATGVASAVSDYSIPASIPIYGQGVTSYAPFLLFFTGYAQAQNTTRYLGGYNCNDAFTGAESEAQIPMPACTLKNLRVSSLTTFTAGQSTTFTVRKNGVDTGLTVTLDNTNQKFNNLANSITFAAGDLMSIKSVASATAGTKYYQATVEVQA